MIRSFSRFQTSGERSTLVLSRRCLFSLVVASVLTITTFVAGSEPLLTSPAAILQQLRDFDNLGSVLFVAAHPDDENTQLITYLSKGRGYRTAYLSLTRGDGGQNELGPEFGEKLGLARTYELLAARQLDGGQQFFTRALDFGFSKSPEESLRIWDRNEVLSDVVRVIRKFRPDVVITRFPIPPGSGGHGHHTASAILAVEAFQLAGDAHAFPEQFHEGLTVWQPKRILWDAGGAERLGSQSAELTLDTTGNDPVTGESFAAIAARSRAMHVTQGFGNFATRAAAAGVHRENFVFLGGTHVDKDLMDGVETKWNRYTGGEEVEQLTQQAVVHFDPADLAANVPALLAIRTQLTTLTSSANKRKFSADDATVDPLLGDKQRQLDLILQACLGLEVRTTLPRAQVVPGEAMHLHFSVREKSSVALRWMKVETKNGTFGGPGGLLRANQMEAIDSPASQDVLPRATPVSQPYWLKNQPEVGLFQVSDHTLIGRPLNPPVWPVIYRFALPNGEALAVTDEPVQIIPEVSAAQIQRPLAAIPPVSIQFIDSVSLFKPGESRLVSIDVTAARAGIDGVLRIKAPEGWTVTPAAQPFQIARDGEKMRAAFQLSSPSSPSQGWVSASAEIKGESYSNQRIEINYRHLPLILLQPPATARVASFPFAIRGHRVAYIAGAGDETVQALEQLGYRVETLGGSDLTAEKLRGFDAVVIGVRAFNVRTDLAAHLSALFAFVEAGGTVVEQYNRPNGLKTDQLGPYSLSLAGDAPRLRITDENSPVTILAPDHPCFNIPNRIGPEDFKNWVQERAAYVPSVWDEQHYVAVLAMNDPGEAPLKSGVLIARHGRGYFVYTSLSFFRQLPAANPGAYRFFANLVSLGKP